MGGTSKILKRTIDPWGLYLKDPKQKGDGGSPKKVLTAFEQQQILQKQAQEASALAQRNAMAQAQDAAARQGATSASQQAQQSLGMMNASQQASDLAKTQAAQSAAAGAGQAVAGGGLDLNAINAGKASNLQSVGGFIPQGQANLAGAANPKNPAATTAGSMTPMGNKGVSGANQFTAPNLSNISFGGV